MATKELNSDYVIVMLHDSYETLVGGMGRAISTEVKVEGWSMMKAEECYNIVNTLNNFNEVIFDDINEVEYNGGKELMKMIKFKSITLDEYTAISKVFGGTSSNFKIITDAMEYIESYDYDED